MQHLYLLCCLLETLEEAHYFGLTKRKVLTELYDTEQIKKSPFEDEQDGNVIVEPIVFEDGFLTVPRTNQVLQKFLHYHPLNGKKFEEVNNEKDAAEVVEALNVQVDALIEAKSANHRAA